MQTLAAPGPRMQALAAPGPRMQTAVFAIGKAPPKQPPLKFKRSRVILPGARESLFEQPSWRILPISACKGLHIWMDLLPGSSGAQKQAKLFRQIATLKANSSCSYSFPPSTLQTECLNRAHELLDLLFWNQSLRWILKRFVTGIRMRSMRKANETDPITLDPIQQPIVLVSFPQQTQYTFEAQTFAKQLHKMLLTNDGHLPTPLLPRNPFTNESLTLPQLMGLFAQCKAYGQTTWAMEAFARCQFSVESFVLLHGKSLRLHAVRATLARIEGWDAIDTLYDFLKTQHAYHKRVFCTSLYKWCLSHCPEHETLQAWRSLCLRYYETDILLDDDLARETALAKISALTKPLCSAASELQEIRAAALKS